MAKEKFYPVEVLVEKMQNGEIGWLEYAQWCSDEGKSICDDTAEEFLALKSVEMEEAMEKGDL